MPAAQFGGFASRLEDLRARPTEHMPTVIAITGARGFIGSYLCKYFSELGEHVGAITRRAGADLQYALPLCEIVEADVLSGTLLRLGCVPDYLIHCATANDVLSQDSKAGVLLSALGTRGALEWAVHLGVPRVLVFSTAQVYGYPLSGVITESSPVRPRSDYALNHLFAEEYLRMYAARGAVRAVVLRPTNVYGVFTLPTVNRWSLVPACFCREAHETRTVTLRSSGMQTRNFVSLDSVARACRAIINRFPDSFSVFNVASNLTLSIRSVAELVLKAWSNISSEPLLLRVLSNEPTHSEWFQVSLGSLKALGFEESPTDSLETDITCLLNSLKRGQYV